ncbi:hypothetical protein VP01_4869g1 [Puccinia sorghi]|uniref:Uncharacterized protein n=1 Tax=Puccinia sorghi TaxID=27349 RepID=A0A0L6UMB8_9BASI|nr:hypothetical protein VP01_4869g1 [Puccinia sorghi]
MIPKLSNYLSNPCLGANIYFFFEIVDLMISNQQILKLDFTIFFFFTHLLGPINEEFNVSIIHWFLSVDLDHNQLKETLLKQTWKKIKGNATESNEFTILDKPDLCQKKSIILGGLINEEIDFLIIDWFLIVGFLYLITPILKLFTPLKFQKFKFPFIPKFNFGFRSVLFSFLKMNFNYDLKSKTGSSFYQIYEVLNSSPRCGSLIKSLVFASVNDCNEIHISLKIPVDFQQSTDTRVFLLSGRIKNTSIPDNLSLSACLMPNFLLATGGAKGTHNLWRGLLWTVLLLPVMDLLFFFLYLKIMEAFESVWIALSGWAKSKLKTFLVFTSKILRLRNQENKSNSPNQKDMKLDIYPNPNEYLSVGCFPVLGWVLRVIVPKSNKKQMWGIPGGGVPLGSVGSVLNVGCIKPVCMT